MRLERDKEIEGEGKREGEKGREKKKEGEWGQA